MLICMCVCTHPFAVDSIQLLYFFSIICSFASFHILQHSKNRTNKCTCARTFSDKMNWSKSFGNLIAFYLLLPLENDMRVPRFLLSCRIVVENVKSGDRFIRFIARFSDRVGVERFRACPSGEHKRVQRDRIVTQIQ